MNGMPYETNLHTFLKMYRDVMSGPICKPRGQLIHEAEDYQFTLSMEDSPLTSFKARNLNLNYAKQEMAWYIRADPYDRTIEQYATMWPKIIQEGGFYYSNYGQYMFRDQGGAGWVVDELARDPDSRRAAIPFLQSRHCFKENKDMVCTYSISFRIRHGRLHMTVAMRSNDAIFGTTNDVFCFAMFYNIIFAQLKYSYYPNLQRGRYTHKVDSLHIYERHWKMAEKIIEEGNHGYYHVHIPTIDTLDEAVALSQRLLYPDQGEFTKWLTTPIDPSS